MNLSALRLGVSTFVVVLLVGLFLGSAVGSLAPQLWSRRLHSTVTVRADSAHVGWKTPPGVTAPAAPIVVSTLRRLPPTPASVVVAFDVFRPPFVPPRS